MADTRLWRIRATTSPRPSYGKFDELGQHTIKLKVIRREWEDMLIPYRTFSLVTQSGSGRQGRCHRSGAPGNRASRTTLVARRRGRRDSSRGPARVSR
ncbi:MAG: hypothetical protein ACRDRD_21510 [Pseudonocardiaceae bacterium]